MKLFNTSANNLRWDLGGKSFTCEPYGEVIVEDELVEHIKTRQLPLSVSPVTPEVRAADTLDAANDAARKDEVASLNKQLTEAVAAEKSVKSELEKTLGAVTVLEGEKAKLTLELGNATDKFTKVAADFQAQTKLFEEQAKELAIKKEELERAKAVIAEIKKAEEAKKPAQPQNQPKNK